MRKFVGLLAVLATVLGLMVVGSVPASAVTGPTGRVDEGGLVDLATLSLRGWVADASVPTRSTAVAVYVDKRGYTFNANQPRPDVARYLKTSWTRFGFDVTVPIPAGSHRVCVYAISLSAAPNRLVECQTIDLPTEPEGHVDKVTQVCDAPATDDDVVLSGWAFDPDSKGGPTGRIAVYVDASNGPGFSSAGQFGTGGARPDVAEVYGLVDNRVGFAVQVGAKYGFDTIRVYVINTAGAGSNRLIRIIHQSDVVNAC